MEISLKSCTSRNWGILGRLGWFEMHSGSWELFATRRAEQVCYLYASFRKRDKHRGLLPPVVPS